MTSDRRGFWTNALLRLRGEERGVIAVLTALFLPVFFGMGALVLDMSHLWQVGRQLQNCVDAAALSAAWELSDVTKATNVANAYMALQGPEGCRGGGSATFTPLDRNRDGRADALEVKVTRPETLGLARILGMKTSNVQKHAVAGKLTPSYFAGMQPFGLQVDPGRGCGGAVTDYRLNHRAIRYGPCSPAASCTYTLKYAASDSPVGAPGNFQPLGLGGPGADTYRDNIISGYQSLLGPCDPATSQTGDLVGPTITGLTERLTSLFAFNSECAAFLARSPSRWYLCPRIITIALIPPLNPGRSDTEILTLAWFYLADYQDISDAGGNAARLTGWFVDTRNLDAPPEKWKGDVPWDPNSSLPFGLKLLE